MTLRAMSLAIALSAVTIPAGFGQEWTAVIHDVLSSDPAVSDAARSRAFGTMIPRLIKEDPALAAREAAEIAESLKAGDEKMRVQGSALLASISSLRTDGAAVLHGLMPVVLGAFRDSAVRVRFNAGSTVSNLQPDIPAEALQPLLGLLHDSDARAMRGAVYGVARFARTSPAAVTGLNALLADHDKPESRRAAMQAMTAAHVAAPTLVAELGAALDEADSEVVVDALQALQSAGHDAMTPYRQKIAALATKATDSRVSRAAQSALESGGEVR